MAERGTGGKILSLATKRARRVQEKMMQKMGKSAQTKDEVFQDFVTNFNRQSATATKLQKELTRFMNAVRVLNQCTLSLGKTLNDLYEPGWAGHDIYGGVLQTRMLLWEDQLSSLQSKMMEPMSNYTSKFPEVKVRIQKRDRKVVDYDLRRRELEALKAKQKVTDQKLQQVEDSYSQAKQLYDEITDELYEELPTFFDSRIQFYASIFQSLAATEAQFHSEMAKVDEEFAGLMDGLASEAATAIHTTKKERTLDSTPKLLSRPGEDSDSDDETLPSPHDLNDLSGTTPDNNSMNEESSNSTASSTPTHSTPDIKAEKDRSSSGAVAVSNGSGSIRRQPPSKPVRSNSISKDSTPQAGPNSTPQAGPNSTPQAGPNSTDKTSMITADQNLENSTDEPLTTPPTDVPSPAEPLTTPPTDVPAEPLTTPPTDDPAEPLTTPPTDDPAQPLTTPPTDEPKTLLHDLSAADLEELDAVIERTEDKIAPTSLPTVPDETTPTPPPTTPPPTTTEVLPLKEPENMLHKVVATHPYHGEDEDELSFEKGTMIAVIPYDDTEDEEEGWSNGVALSTGKRGIFPNNFTKKI